MAGKYQLKEGGEKTVIDLKEGLLHFQCCDCGLVHDMIFEAWEDKLILRIWRNNRSTGQLRRHHSFPFKEPPNGN